MKSLSPETPTFGCHVLYQEAERQPGAEVSMNTVKQTNKKKCVELSPHTLTLQHVGRDQAKSRANPLLSTVGYCSQDRHAPAARPAAEACWNHITPLTRHPAMSPQASRAPCAARSLCRGSLTDGICCPPPRAAHHPGWGLKEGGSAGAGPRTRRPAPQCRGGHNATTRHRRPPARPPPRACAAPPRPGRRAPRRPHRAEVTNA